LRIALVGLGNAGCNLHLPALAGIPGVRLVGATDPHDERRTSARDRFGVPVFPGFDEMVGESKPDVIVIGSPPDSHADYCLRGLAAGAHVICEKPFVSSIAEADQVLDAAKRAGRRVALNHEFREMPIFRTIRDAITDRGTGSLTFAQVWQLMDLPPWAEPGWRGRMLQRTLYEAGVHLVDFLMALFDERPVAVQATTSTCGVREGHSDAVALVTLEFSRGRLAQIVQNRLCKGETQYFEVRAETERASLRASFGGRARLTAGLLRSTRPQLRFEFGASGIAWRERGHRREVLCRNPRNPAMLATRQVFQRTLAAFGNGGQPPASEQVGRDVMVVIAAAYQSAITGQRISINDDLISELRNLHLG